MNALHAAVVWYSFAVVVIVFGEKKDMLCRVVASGNYYLYFVLAAWHC